MSTPSYKREYYRPEQMEDSHEQRRMPEVKQAPHAYPNPNMDKLMEENQRPRSLSAPFQDRLRMENAVSWKLNDTKNEIEEVFITGTIDQNARSLNRKTSGMPASEYFERKEIIERKISALRNREEVAKQKAMEFEKQHMEAKKQQGKDVKKTGITEKIHQVATDLRSIVQSMSTLKEKASDNKETIIKTAETPSLTVIKGGKKKSA